MHVCPKCSQNGFVDLAALVSHICLHHGNEPNFSVSCSLHSRVFRNIGSFRGHIYRNHHDEVVKQIGPTAQIVTNIQCPVCGEFVHGGLALLSSHYRVHCDSGQVVKCVVDGCSSEYSTYSSYSSHMSRKHKLISSLNESLGTTATDSQNDTGNCSDAGSGDMEITLDHDQEILKSVALLFLKLQEGCMLSAATLQVIVDNFTNILDISTNKTQAILRQLLEENKVDLILQDQVLTANQCYVFSDAFSELRNDCRRKILFK